MTTLNTPLSIQDIIATYKVYNEKVLDFRRNDRDIDFERELREQMLQYKGLVIRHKTSGKITTIIGARTHHDFVVSTGGEIRITTLVDYDIIGIKQHTIAEVMTIKAEREAAGWSLSIEDGLEVWTAKSRAGARIVVRQLSDMYWSRELLQNVEGLGWTGATESDFTCFEDAANVYWIEIDRPISSLDLSPQVINKLQSLDIFYVDDLPQLDNASKSCLRELKQLLNK